MHSGLHQVGHAAAENVLLAKEVGLGLGLEVGLEKCRASSADGSAIGQGEVERVAGGVLVGADQARGTLALNIGGADGVAGSLGGNHDHVAVRADGDAAVVDVEAVREGDGLARGEVRLDVLLVHLGLILVVDQDHDDVSPLGGLGVGDDLEALLLGLGLGLGTGAQANLHVHTGVLQVQRVRVTLRAVANDCDLLAVELADVAILLVEHPECHLFFPFA